MYLSLVLYSTTLFDLEGCLSIESRRIRAEHVTMLPDYAYDDVILASKRITSDSEGTSRWSEVGKCNWFLVWLKEKYKPEFKSQFLFC